MDETHVVGYLLASSIEEAGFGLRLREGWLTTITATVRRESCRWPADWIFG